MPILPPQTPQDMFDLCVAIGAKLHVHNARHLTALTLAAKLARAEVGGVG